MQETAKGQEIICTAETTYSDEFHRKFNLAFLKHVSWKRTLLWFAAYFAITNLSVFLIYHLMDRKIGVSNFLLTCVLPVFIVGVAITFATVFVTISKSYRNIVKDLGGETPVMSFAFTESGFVMEFKGSNHDSAERTYAQMTRIIADDNCLMFVYPSNRSATALAISSLSDPDRLLSVLSKLPQFRDKRRTVRTR